MIGMTIAVLATVFGPRVTMAGLPWIIAAMVVGRSIAFMRAQGADDADAGTGRAEHSLVGLAACLVGFANYIDPMAALGLSHAEKAIHEIEVYVGILIVR